MPLPQRFSLLVLGQGTSGLEVVSWAVAHLSDRVASVTVYGGEQSSPTDRTEEFERAGARFVYGTQDIEGSFDVCVASPGISEFCEFFRNASAASAQIMGEPEFAYRLSPERWCAITGTNGKTTATSLTNELLRASGMPSVAVGNIGNAPIHEVDRRRPNEWFVAELSSYQIATTSELHPRVAVLLNITPDHLSWHRTHENYALAKIKLFENMGPEDLCIVNVEDEGIASFGDRIYIPGRRVLKLGLHDAGGDDAAFVRDGMLAVRLSGSEHGLVRIEELKIAGAHNVLDALAASAAALVSSRRVSSMACVMSTIPRRPIPMRSRPPSPHFPTIASFFCSAGPIRARTSPISWTWSFRALPVWCVSAPPANASVPLSSMRPARTPSILRRPTASAMRSTSHDRSRSAATSCCFRPPAHPSMSFPALRNAGVSSKHVSDPWQMKVSARDAP